jgi:tripartite-type tricarboxylate transporter receptor subunit TctC
VAKFSAALKKVVRDPQVVDQVTTLGAEPEAMSPEEFRVYLEKEEATWLPVVRRVSAPP